jgi:RAB6A-GEF complex partner protein 2
VYNISNSRGRVCRLILFKNNFKLGEDILGTIDFDHTDVPCVQFTVTLQSEELLNTAYRRKSTQTSNITSFTKQSEFSLSTTQTYLSLAIPLSCSPTFVMDIGRYHPLMLDRK